MHWGVQSAMLKSYMAAIKHILKRGNYKWDESKAILHTLIRACKLSNNTFYTHLPIHIALLEMILFELSRKFSTQPYLETLYQAMFLLAYYGLMRIGELTKGEHPVRAKDVHIGSNKNKILLILHSSKTHGKEAPPQKIKISQSITDVKRKKLGRNFCPFERLHSYLQIRGNFTHDDEPLFVFFRQVCCDTSSSKEGFETCFEIPEPKCITI